jgi:hypothetical protein
VTTITLTIDEASALERLLWRRCSRTGESFPDSYEAERAVWRKLTAAIENRCPDCGGKGGVAPNGVRYCNCDDEEAA